MDLSRSKVLITGGSDGIGKGLAKRFIEAGSRVIVTGRSAEKLKNAASEMPTLETFVNDIGNPGEREMLAAYIKENMPDINVLINNAGIQRRVELAADTASWPERQAEIDILLSGPVHLNHLLIPVLLQHDGPSRIVNVTSGGAYIPQVFAPMYSACKAALHSYTMTLRYALANTSCGVVELIPPAVMTSLAGKSQAHGADLDAFCDYVFPSLLVDHVETVGYGPTEQLEPQLSGQSVSKLLETSASRFPVEQYSQG